MHRPVPRAVTLALAGLTASGASLGTAAQGRVREPALAGTWYPGPRPLLAATARNLLRSAGQAPAPSGRPVALVVPHAGWQYSGVAAAAAFRRLGPGDFDRVVVVAPSHHEGFTGYAIDDAAAYRTALGDIPLAAGALRSLSAVARVVAGAAGPEHAIEIELPFLQATLGRFELVPVLVGQTDAASERAFAARLAALDDGRTLFVFSSDFTHYGARFGFTPFGPSALAASARIRAMDDRAVELVSRVDAAGFRAFLSETGATICGRSGLSTLLELLPRIAPNARATLLAHFTSNDVPGMRDESSVDYVAIAFNRASSEPGPSRRPLTVPPAAKAVSVGDPPVGPALGERLVRLARASVESAIRGGDATEQALAALDDAPEAARLQAVFVTLQRTDPDEIRREGTLRGCIGQLEPVHPLDVAVVEAAVAAAREDPRFRPVEARELSRLSVEVTVLTPPRPVGSWREIELGRHGIILARAGRRAVFLPQVPGEQGWTLEETLAQLALKAGLPADAWREGASFSVFTGQVFREASARPQARR